MNSKNIPMAEYPRIARALERLLQYLNVAFMTIFVIVVNILRRLAE